MAQAGAARADYVASPRSPEHRQMGRTPPPTEYFDGECPQMSDDQPRDVRVIRSDTVSVYRIAPELAVLLHK